MKPCTNCRQPSSIRYRIQINQSDIHSGKWHLVCLSCWDLSKDSPNYRYGGTWKARN